MSSEDQQSQSTLQSAFNFVKEAASAVVNRVEDIAETAKETLLGGGENEEKKVENLDEKKMDDTQPGLLQQTKDMAMHAKDVVVEKVKEVLPNIETPSMEDAKEMAKNSLPDMGNVYEKTKDMANQAKDTVMDKVKDVLPKDETPKVDEAKEESNEESTHDSDIHTKEIGKHRPAAKVGGMRISQNPTGPHLFKKADGTTHHHSGTHHFEKKEDHEMTSTELAKREKEIQLAHKAEDLKRHVLKNAPKDSKAFPSTYHNPIPTHDDHLKINPGGLGSYANPMHGHKNSQ